MLQFATVKLNQHSFDNGKQTFVIGHRAKRWFCRTPRHHCTKYYDSFTSCCCCTPPYVRLTSPHRDTLAQQRSATLFLPQSHSLSLSLSLSSRTHFKQHTQRHSHTPIRSRRLYLSLYVAHILSLVPTCVSHQASRRRSFVFTDKIQVGTFFKTYSSGSASWTEEKIFWPVSKRLQSSALAENEYSERLVYSKFANWQDAYLGDQLESFQSWPWKSLV